jgi:hypothetical protein
MGRRGVETDNASCLNWLQPLYANQTPDPVSQQNLAIDKGGSLTLVNLVRECDSATESHSTRMHALAP